MSFKVVILSANPVNLTACIYAVLANEPDLLPEDIIVVGDETRWACEAKLPSGINWVAGKRPFVFARNANIGIRAAGNSDVVLLNDDARLQTWRGFSRMAEEWAKCPTVGIVAPCVRGMCGNPRQQEHESQGMAIERERLCFVGVFLPAKTRELVGTLDERFVGYGFDDDDYCVRVRKAGLNLAIYGDCVLEHESLTPTFRSDDSIAEKYETNRAAFHEKWSGKMEIVAYHPPIFSVLIPSLKDRRAVRNILLQHLNTLRAQLADPWDVEIVLNIDNREKKVGRKRVELAWQARGAYSAYVDDDDQVDCRYFVDILAAIRANLGVDTIVFDAWVTWEGRAAGLAVYDMAFGAYSNEAQDDGICLYKRTPNHLSATRTALVRQVGFKELNCGEDTDYAERLLPLLKTQARIDGIRYFYQYSPTLTETQRNIGRDQITANAPAEQWHDPIGKIGFMPDGSLYGNYVSAMADGADIRGVVSA